MVGNWVVAFRDRSSPDDFDCLTTVFYILSCVPLQIPDPVGCRRVATCYCLTLKSMPYRKGISWRFAFDVHWIRDRDRIVTIKTYSTRFQ